MIAAGDLNSDRRDDLVVLGKDVTYVVFQNDKGEMQTAKAADQYISAIVDGADR